MTRNRYVGITCGTLLLVALAVGLAPAQQAPPVPSINIPCRVLKVTDGDTVDVEVRFTVRVRLLDCWAPETKGDERPEGLVSADKLRAKIAATDGSAVLAVPLPASGNLMDALTFGRVLGHVWLTGERESISAWMVKEKLATTTKQKK